MLVLSNNSSTPSAFGLSKKLALILLASCEPVQGIFSSQSFTPWRLVKKGKVKNALGLGLAAMVPRCLPHGKFINSSSKAGLTEHRARPERIEAGIFSCICTHWRLVFSTVFAQFICKGC